MFVSSILNLSWLDFITMWLVDFEYLTWPPLPGVSIPDWCPLWGCSAIHPACQYDVRTQAFESGPPEVHHSQGRSQSPEGAGKHLYLYVPRGTQGLLAHRQQGSPHYFSLCDAGAASCSHIGDHTWGCCVCVTDQPESDCSCEQWAEQELLQQQRPECICCWSASKDEDGKNLFHKKHPWQMSHLCQKQKSKHPISAKPDQTLCMMMKTCVSCVVGVPTCPSSGREAGLDL